MTYLAKLKPVHPDIAEGGPRPRPKKLRDLRLDFFRGVALLIIFIAHARGNALAEFIPARFGPSDAAYMFVFLSGLAASIAFGGTFRRSGFALGCARIAQRCWQLYIAHLALFFAAVAAMAALSAPTGTDYVSYLGLDPFIADPHRLIPRLFGLSYVPHLFDIMPLYIVLLAGVPIVVLLARVRPALAVAASIALWGLAQIRPDLSFLADPMDERLWYFNPLAWQLVFYLGFFLGSGWVRPPAPSRVLDAFAVAVTAGCAYMSLTLPREAFPLSDKTTLGPLALTHFLALAYLGWRAITGREHILEHRYVALIVKCGQQALSVFLSGLLLALLAGIAFDLLGEGLIAQIGINLAAFAVLVTVAHAVAWFKSTPWKAAPVAVLLLAATLPAAAEERVGTLEHDGRERSWRLHLPDNTPADARLPLVVALHGVGGDARTFAETTGLSIAAHRLGFAVVYPEGLPPTGAEWPRTWNAGFCCGEARRSNRDDIGFLLRLAEHLEATAPVDARHLFVTGFSNGGMLAYRLAGEAPSGMVVAVAGVAAAIAGRANTNAPMVEPRRPKRPVSALMIHGKLDQYVLFDGGVSSVLGIPGRFNASAAAGLVFWAEADECRGVPAETETADLRMHVYRGCRDGSEVMLITAMTAGHDWPDVALGPEAPTTADVIMGFFANRRPKN